MHKKVQRSLFGAILFFTLSFFQPCYASPAGATVAAATVTTIGLAGAIIAMFSSKDSDNPNKAQDKNSDKTVDIKANQVLLSAPKEPQDLVITNISKDKTVKIVGVMLDNNIHDVSVGDLGACQAVASQATCKVPLTANSVNSYGQGGATITYNNGATTKSITTYVSVASATLELYDANKEPITLIAKDKDIILPYLSYGERSQPESQTVTYQFKNTGKFNWQNAGVSWQTMFDSKSDPTTGSEDYVELQNNCRGTVGANGGTCSFVLNVKDNHIGDWGIIKASGLNVTTYLENILAAGGLSIAPNQDSDNHLVYKAIKIINAAPDTATAEGWGDINITGIAVSGTLAEGRDPRVAYCPSDATNCDGYTTNCPNKLSPGKHCLVWLKANSKKADNTDFDLTPRADNDTIKVAVSGTEVVKAKGKIETRKLEEFYEGDCTFKASYDKALYAGGDFNDTTQGEEEESLLLPNHIGKWDGSTWSPLASEDSLSENVEFNSVHALTVAKGDLYVGGDYLMKRWNGAEWSDLGQPDGSVYALTSIGGYLYAGGSFTNIDNNNLNFIARRKIINGHRWEVLRDGLSEGGDGVFALTSIGDKLYVGGWFNLTSNEGAEEGSATSTAIASWSQGDGWTSLGSNFGESVYALTHDNESNLYAGGEFESFVKRINTQGSGGWEDLSALDYVYALNIPDVSYTYTEAKLFAGGNHGVSILQGDNSWILGDVDINKEKINAMTSLSISTGEETGVNKLFVGGSFDGFIAEASNTTTWSYLNNNNDNRLDAEVYALTISPSLTISDYAWPEETK